MSRRNKTNGPAPRTPGASSTSTGATAPTSSIAPPPLSARLSAADLAAEAAAATERQRRRRPKNGAKPGLKGGFGPSAAGVGPHSPLAVPVATGQAAPWAIDFMLGESQYNEAAFNSASQDISTNDRWGYYPDRKVRYDVFWGHYEGNVYRAIHRWAAALKVDRQLYAYTRTIFSPAYRIGEFWAGHLWGGPIDPDAGDGVGQPSSLPIIVPDGSLKEDALRLAIAIAWEYSLWQSKKDTVTRTGAVKGDVGMLVHDDGSSVSIRVVDPGTIVDVRRDSRGNVKEYILQEWRNDPEYESTSPFGRLKCRYNEWCRKVGGRVVYTTYRNGTSYDWREYPEGTPEENEVGPEWYAGYDFVPLVFIQHRDMNKGFGWSELQPDFGKMYELDDVASKLSDQIRKIVDCPWFLAGARPDNVAIDLTDDFASEGDGRLKTPIWYGPEGAKPEPMIAPLDITAVGEHIKAILEDLERDHPELATDNVGLASSGEARRVAREKVEAMVVSRRAAYDEGLVHILQMLISIGAMNGYPGFEAFDEGSYDRGELDFSIGPRPVFAVDAGEKMAESKAVMDSIKAGVDAGLPLEFAMEMAGIAEDKIEEVMALIAKKEAKAHEDAMKQQQDLMALNSPDMGGDGGGSSGGAGGTGPDGSPPTPMEGQPAGGPGKGGKANFTGSAGSGGTDSGGVELKSPDSIRQ